MTLPRTAVPQVTARWYEHPAAAPADTRRAPHPSRTRTWASAWSTLTTERILEHHHLHLTDPATGDAETVSYFLTAADGCPYWTSQETDADVPPVWSGTVLYAGNSPHAEYGGAGTATATMASATTRAGLDLAARLGASALVHPGLDRHQADRLTAAAHAAGAGQVLDLATDVAWTRTLGPTIEQWWQGMPSRQRRDIRRRWRRGTEAGLVLDPLTTSRDILDAVPAFAPMAAGTADRHGTRLYGSDMFEQLVAVPGTVLLAARHDGRLVGGIYGWLYDGCLYLWASGLDYEHPAAPLVYTWLMCESARWAIDQGAILIDAGRANHLAKARLGYRPRILRTVVHLIGHQPDTEHALRRLSQRLGNQAAPHLPPPARW
ncbi:GNAT family N-acetyltransferase [Kitasatospora sp. NPDC059327]|uniref:GNAT family N-acetyltransferase n=1 Tax=Kitasatospora sp. NPDC059327 TaxID=3346803 RepID=UPI00369EF1CF